MIGRDKFSWHVMTHVVKLLRVFHQITVYDQEYYQGRWWEFTSCCKNIMEYGMENIRSMKVECGA